MFHPPDVLFLLTADLIGFDWVFLGGVYVVCVGYFHILDLLIKYIYIYIYISFYGVTI